MNKLAKACFIGGSIGMAISLLVATYWWWLGMLAGGAAGYVAYEFREAWQAAISTLRTTPNTTRGIVLATKEWLQRKHPFLYGSFFLTGASLSFLYLHSPTLDGRNPGIVIGGMVYANIIGTILLVLLCVAGLSIHHKDCYELHPKKRIASRHTWAREMAEEYPEYQIIDFTYTNVLRYTLAGLYGLPFSIGMAIFFGIAWCLKIFGLWVIRIHRKERIIALLYSATGTAIGHFIFGSITEGHEYSFAIIATGCISAFLAIPMTALMKRVPIPK